MKKLILASASKARREILLNAGVNFEVQISNVDEAINKENTKLISAGEIALKLAKLKAKQISNINQNTFVIGADQMLECQGAFFDKPVNQYEASLHLKALRGKSHRLISSVCVVCNNKVLWHVTDSVNLTMRNLSDEFIENYLTQAGTEILSSVGGYRLEGLGAQLFTNIDGDFFTVLGLPLLPLLEFLRIKQILNI